jgi:type 2 lantibiotic biosynthesis protein LanM
MIKTPQWYAAIYLDERIEQFRTHDLPPSFSTKERSRAEKFLQKWKVQTPFNHSDFFMQRLSIIGVSESELLDLLSYSSESLRDQFNDCPPAWLVKLERAFADADEDAGWISNHYDLNKDPAACFLYIAAPLIQDAYREVTAAVDALAQRYGEVVFEKETAVSLLLRRMVNNLLTIISRVLVMEMRLTNMQGMLKGESSKARFSYFIEQLSNKSFALDLLRMYPVMARHIVTHIQFWVEAHLEFLERLCVDAALLHTTFAVDNQSLGQFTGLQTELGDRHRNGRTVMIATFSSGIKIVYKPKSLTIDARFQQILNWFNAANPSLPLIQSTVIDRGAYGWVEFAKTKSCRTNAEVTRFYQRMGAYLAILYSLKSVDFHAENLIAVGEHPMMIDLETLFHSHFASTKATGANRDAEDRYQSSVLEIGLLPQRIWGGSQGVGVDVSGLGAPRKQPSPRRTLVWEHAGTDKMRASYKFVDFEMNTENRPLLNGEDVKLEEYMQAVRDGFVTYYCLIEQHRQSYKALVTRLFAEVDVRILVRPTQLYNMLLTQSGHPDHLRNALSVDRLFDKLWLGVRQNTKLAQMIPSELKSLQQGDIPVFTTRPNSSHLWDSQGQEISNCLPETGLSLVQNRIEGFGARDLQRQLWLIETTFAAILPPKQAHLHVDVPRKVQKTAVQQRALQVAQNIGQRLQELRIGKGDDASWLVFSMNAQRGWSASPADFNLYDGVGGIGFFLAYLADVTDDPQFKKLAQSAIKAMWQQIPLNVPIYDPIGGFEGWGSVVYNLTHLGALWDQPALWHEAVSIARLIPQMIAKDSRLDIIAGAAGSIAALLTLHRLHPSDELLQIATLCGDHLLQNSVQMDAGTGWLNHIAKKRPLTGFSHGAAGMAWSLLQLADATGEARFYDTAVDAITYERSLFMADHENWQDLRLAQRDDAHDACGCALAWCHGAPGIGLGRMVSLPYMDNMQVRQEIETAVSTTLQTSIGSNHPGFGANYSLCHGDLGNLETLLMATERLGPNPELDEALYRKLDGILNHMDSTGWLCGVPQGLQTPGLMTGIAGIGYQLLRLSKPDRVPSLLGLQRPIV